MEKFEVESGVTGLRNWCVPVPGTDVVAHLGNFGASEDGTVKWAYSLWDDDDTRMLESDWVTLPERVTAEQAARIAFILEFEPTPEGAELARQETESDRWTFSHLDF